MDKFSHGSTRVFAIADLHFRHAKILEYDKRPFSSIHAHDETIIANWNASVRPEDVVYCLGDICFRADDGIELVSRRNGSIHLVQGNHNWHALSVPEYPTLFESVRSYAEVSFEGTLFVFSHYPILEWNKCHRGAIHCHGHVHGKLTRTQPWYYRFRVFDLGVNLWDYAPVSLNHLIRLAKQRKELTNHEQSK